MSMISRIRNRRDAARRARAIHHALHSAASRQSHDELRAIAQHQWR